MKILVSLSNDGFGDNRPYKMHIVDIEEITEGIYYKENETLDINKLKECVNITVNENNFKNDIQNPKEYIEANFDIGRLIGFGKKAEDFHITNVYYDEDNKPQLYRVVDSHGIISIHDISEFEYRKKSSLLGSDLDNLPSFVKKEPISKAYEWWKLRDEASKQNEKRGNFGHFEAEEDMSVKVLYHYLTGARGFKVGYHTITEIEKTSEIQHEYMLFKDMASIKLVESIPKEKEMDNLSLNDKYDVFGFKKEPYPSKRQLKYHGASMTVSCNRENYPTFDFFNGPSFQCSSQDRVDVDIKYQDGLMSVYNKLEDAGCIEKVFKLDNFRMFINNLLPEEIVSLSKSLQKEKDDNKNHGFAFPTGGHFSTLNTRDWINVIGLAVSMQYFSSELLELIEPIHQQYKNLYLLKLGELIENIGAYDALEVMKWTKENIANVLENISLVNKNGAIVKNDTSIMDQIDNLFSFKRNNSPLPEWLQIYSPETIESMGGVDLLIEAIEVRGEKVVKETMLPLIEAIEHEEKQNNRLDGKKYINPNEIIISEKVDQPNETNHIKL